MPINKSYQNMIPYFENDGKTIGSTYIKLLILEPILDHKNLKANSSPFFLSSYTMLISKIIFMVSHQKEKLALFFVCLNLNFTSHSSHQNNGTPILHLSEFFPSKKNLKNKLCLYFQLKNCADDQV